MVQKKTIEKKVLEKPEVDTIVGIHVNPWIKKSSIGLKQGEMMAAADKFTIDVLGKGSHGAYPHLGKDAVLAASHLVIALQSLVSREIDPLDSVVVSVGKIEGGREYNILADKVTLTGTVRTLNEKIHKDIKFAIKKKARDICSAFGLTYKFNYETFNSVLKNDEDTLKLCFKAGMKTFNEEDIVILERPSMGGEDFSEYLKYAKGAFVYLGSADKNSYPWHHEKFDIDEDILPKGAKFLAETVLEFYRS